MNKYHIQIDNHTTNCWDWITVHAHTLREALFLAKIQLSNYQTLEQNDYWSDYYVNKYRGFEISSVYTEIIDCGDFPPYDTIILENKLEDGYMNYFKVNWNNHTEQLALLAAQETWSNETYPNNGILANYLIHTYEKLKSEKNIISNNNYGLFNTGLFTKYYEPIYAYATDQNTISFITDYELGNIGIKERPERANYFVQPDLLLFDWHYQINVQYKHILDDSNNRQRIPNDILESGNVVTVLDGAINTMKKRVSANYKLAIPQYFGKQVQLLLPLCLRTDNQPDLALAVTRKNGYYQGHTCLTLDMAYNNARLIAKPESNWLSQ